MLPSHSFFRLFLKAALADIEPFHIQTVLSIHENLHTKHHGGCSSSSQPALLQLRARGQHRPKNGIPGSSSTQHGLHITAFIFSQVHTGMMNSSCEIGTKVFKHTFLSPHSLADSLFMCWAEVWKLQNNEGKTSLTQQPFSVSLLFWVLESWFLSLSGRKLF